MEDGGAAVAAQERQPPPEDGGGSGEAAAANEAEEEEEMIVKAQKYMELIVSSSDNPNPKLLHALASLLEIQEYRYMAETGHSSSGNDRGSHGIGRLGNSIRENDDFFELISSKFLSDSRYSVSVQAASTRVLLNCSLTWVYPHVFEEDVLENIKNWVLDDGAKSSNDGGVQQHQLASDFDMRKTYSTGLLAVCLTSGSQVVEDVLTSGLAVKLMRYLRMRVLGETIISQKDSCRVVESKNVSIGGGRGRDECRARLRQTLDSASLDDSRTREDGGLGDVNSDNVHMSGGLDREVDLYDADIDDENRWHVQDLHDGRFKHGPGIPMDNEDLDESSRDDPSRRRVNRGCTRPRGKPRVNENNTESEQSLLSPGSGSRGGQGRSGRDRSLVKTIDGKRMMDNKKARATAGGIVIDREDTDDCYQDCKVGTKDISDLVKSAVRAAEAEARAANAPVEAVKAAGDAAADLVKSAAIDEFKKTSDEEAAVVAASRAASTVIDAANTIEVTRKPESINAESLKTEVTEADGNENIVEYAIPDSISLAQQREKFCIQCLVILGEYVEVLGPVLHEKGVDVCIALLQQYSKDRKESELESFLPDVLKLISALAAH